MKVVPKRALAPAPATPKEAPAPPQSVLEACPQPERIVTVLAISPFDEDRIVLGNIFGHSNWKLHYVPTWQDALAYLSDHTMPVIICECELPDATWKEVLCEVTAQRNSPVLIVTSRLADDQLWGEVLNLGGYDVLMKPFDPMEVFRVVSLAWLNWKSNLDRLRERTATRLVAAAGD